MTRRRHNLLLVALIVLVPAAVLAYVWHTWAARQLAAAQKALATGDAGRAEELLVSLLREQSDDPTVHFVHAQALRRLKRYSEAETALQMAVARGLDQDKGRREVALLLAVRDWPKEAEGILQKVARDNPDDVEVLQTLAQGYARRQRWAEAERLYSRLIELQPEEIDHLYQRGWARQENTQFEKAAGDFRQVLVRSPAHFHARLYLAHSLLSDAHMAEAEAELLTCRQLRPDRVEPLVGLVNCAVEHNDLKAAESWLAQAVALDSSSPLVLHEVVNLHLRRGRYEPAEEVLLFLVRQSPNDKQAHLKLAQNYRRKGDLERAARHQQRYQELDQLEEVRARGMR